MEVLRGSIDRLNRGARAYARTSRVAMGWPEEVPWADILSEIRVQRCWCRKTDIEPVSKVKD